ncbi:hypothetical protein ACFVT2_25245 [Streptomyces sp. NPDC058000]|uniref:hypothetical protein n=1 Tax=Streptomyces sp. NPDC058000 TaxID=3346299 RepID=UPI0036E55C0F
MSNSAAYRWSYVDVEAERRRELRAQLAQETARARELQEQARALRRVHRTAPVDVPVVTVSSQAGSEELGTALESARRTNQRAEAELGRAAAGIWSVPPERSDRPATPPPAARQRAAQEAERARQERSAQVRAAALVEAEALLHRDGPACEPADLPGFARRLEALRRADSPEAARTLLADLGVLVHKSALRQRAAARTAALRARLLDRLADTEPTDRQRLAAAVAEAPDPSHLQDEVEQAVQRADAARYRSAVADTVMQVLRQRHYAVGEDFADLLAADGSVIVPFGAAAGAPGTGSVPEGYGLRVALPADRPGLTTALVRAPQVGTDDGGSVADPGAETDDRVQRWFCDDQLPGIEDAIRGHGVGLDRTSALPPGVRRTVVVPDAPWPETGRARDDRTHDDRTHDRTTGDRTAEDRAAGDRAPARRPAKKATPPRTTAYPQERQRER